MEQDDFELVVGDLRPWANLVERRTLRRRRRPGSSSRVGRSATSFVTALGSWWVWMPPPESGVPGRPPRPGSG